MDFKLSDDLRALRDTARKFARTEMPEVARRMEETHQPMPAEMIRRLGEMGFLGLNIPTEYGGLGAGKVAALLVLEEFSKISAAAAFPIFEATSGPCQTILYHGPEWLKKEVLPKVCAGDMLVAVSMTEPDAGTAMTDLTTTGTIKGGKVILNGVKRWCSGSGWSQGYVIYCRMADKPGAGGIGAVYVAKGTPGMTHGKPEDMVFYGGNPNAEIYLDNVEVPVDNIVVPVGRFKDLMQSFNMERLGNAGCSLGIAASALEYAVEYVQERHQFGKPLCEFQAVQMRLADMAMDVEAARLLIHRAAQNAEDGLPSISDTSIAKCFVNEAVRRVTAHGVQLMGGYGVSKAYPMEQKMRDSWVWGLGGGGIDLQKINIASELVGKRFNQRGR